MPNSNAPIKGLSPEDVVARQNYFLRAYAEYGTITSACKAVSIDRKTAHRWVSGDMQGFRDRFQEAREEFADSLEEMAFERLKEQGPRDNPVLLITMLNAHKPNKYRPQASNDDESARQILFEMKNKFKSIIGNSEVVEEEEKTTKQLADTVIRGKRNEE